ncbi:MAG: uridine-cytidine kinase [Armatimonadetes bacterium]|nr:uridine-cytidine kinase [Armatimonadota bacterium]
MGERTRPLVVGIAGGSGSGKTYLARQIVNELGEDKAALLSMDQYFRSNPEGGASPGDINFDHPAHLDFRTLIADVRQLKAGKPASVPNYDFATMRQVANSCTVTPLPVIVVEGLFVLAEPMVSLCDLTCFLDVASDERLLGRILRDVREREVSIEEVIDRYQRFVRPSYRVFVEPTMQNADVVVDFTFRRSMFTRLLIGMLQSYLVDRPKMELFVAALRDESYRLSAHLDDGFMSMSTDIFKLAKAYPESTFGPDSGRVLASPASASLSKRSRRTR